LIWNIPADPAGCSVAKEVNAMAKCANCGKTTTFGRNVSFSKRHTSRVFLPNLQKTRVLDAERGRYVQKTLCAKCIKAMSKLK
jgi:large subunit ribosomal protein L28